MQFYTKIIAESGGLNILADIMVSGEIILISTGMGARTSHSSEQFGGCRSTWKPANFPAITNGLPSFA